SGRRRSAQLAQRYCLEVPGSLRSPARSGRRAALFRPRRQDESSRRILRLAARHAKDRGAGSMSAHLLLVTLGPVQDFIAQARRTRDLWYGSHLLSELARAAARAIDEGDARLVFPALGRNHPELVECKAPLRDTGAPLAIA